MVKIAIDDLVLCASFEVETFLNNEAADQWATPIIGELYISNDDDAREVIGKCHYFYLDVDSALEAGIHIFDVLDINSGTAPFFRLYTKEGAFSEAVLDATGLKRTDSRNLLIGSRLEILPAYRRIGISRYFTDEIFRLFRGRAKVAALKSFPLQLEARNESSLTDWDHKMQLGELTRNPSRAKAQLNRYYSSQGYTKVGRHGLMIKLIPFQHRLLATT